jgi:hypothetical protein
MGIIRDWRMDGFFRFGEAGGGIFLTYSIDPIVVLPGSEGMGFFGVWKKQQNGVAKGFLWKLEGLGVLDNQAFVNRSTISQTIKGKTQLIHDAKT